MAWWKLMLGCPRNLAGLGVLYLDVTACQAANATTALTPEVYAQCYENHKLPKQQIFPTNVTVTPSLFQNPGVVIPTTGESGINPLLPPGLGLPPQKASSSIWLWLIIGGMSLVVISGSRR
jgi:hypothetical protein